MINKLIYIGTSPIFISKIIESNITDLSIVFCEDKRITDKYLEIVKKHNLTLKTFTSKKELEELILTYGINGFDYVVYQLDFIIPGSVANRFKIFNLHAGSLKYNRGAHPIIWSILNNDQHTELSLHQINEKIDQGVLVAKHPVQIEKFDDAVTIKNKMEAGLSFLLNQLDLYLQGKIKGSQINGGKYYKPIQPINYTINPYLDEKNAILNKIRSQIQYNGALIILNGTTYNIKKLIKWENIENDIKSIEINDDVITIMRSNATYQLKIENYS